VVRGVYFLVVVAGLVVRVCCVRDAEVRGWVAGLVLVVRYVPVPGFTYLLAAVFVLVTGVLYVRGDVVVRTSGPV